ncbi:endonuclease/exonuclease/phosphatase family protein [Algoriphagus winogradskyi]|uniref:Metal-dependent hydrolase, endonuclease/exonuclease/phosphatase family n=1 Tax=Algoriphagus winogradskyi TaxID=237017 RepID=A0ABY1NCU1_9BACT|nr:endonuclease/exonuclease/phosphatase family protein [Algoriphagus winogradskyi]SMP06602.1 Metal-dependent hydrolase, endonuclease/exonuclease/phosphatase family [Algoriphagus winogradskyi]
MKKTSFVLVVFLLGLHFSLFAQEKYPEFKVLTYNIYHGEKPDSLGKPNLDDIANLVILLQPEVVAFQEVDSMTTRSEEIYGKKIDWIAELGKKTGYRSYFAKAMDFAEGAYGEGILIKKALNYTTLQLPTPVEGEARAAAWAKIELRDRKELYFGATHLCHQFPENRLAQLDSMISYADSLPNPAFWVGDLNFDPASEEYKSIPEKWSDAGMVANDTTPTFNSEEGKRIDYVWYDSEYFELVNYQVIDATFSDHYPVLVTLRLIKPYKE